MTRERKNERRKQEGQIKQELKKKKYRNEENIGFNNTHTYLLMWISQFLIVYVSVCKYTYTHVIRT
jgi:hypothetical protein